MAIINNAVRSYNSTMPNGPQLPGTAGSLVALLKACLVDGFDTRSVNSISVSGGIATATISAGNPFAANDVIRIAGATGALSALNGDWRLSSGAATTVTFDVGSMPDGSATGTMTALRAPAGWVQAFSATNKAAFKSGDVTATGKLLRLDDSAATYARVIGYETMSDVDSGTGPFPTEVQQAGGGYWGKSSVSGATVRAWRIRADALGFEISVQYDGTNWITAWFGDLIREFPTDEAAVLLTCGASATVSNMGLLPLFGATSGHFMPRAWTQAAGAIQARKFGHPNSSAGAGYAGLDYPAPGSGLLYATPIEVWESGAVLRGVLPGLYAPIHPAAQLTDGSAEPSVSGMPGRRFVIQRTSYAGSNYAFAIDTTGPWR
ncbi:hypothetical protein SAMN05421829_108170 [Aromatoleum tolulyticum]|uniref:Uncharacterized protein n=1 Tax=Aromatoleum tolulyticum TaxID=34027 RepID=A0A1N6X320_9RHOO|nr:hypothetical protein [Aromatoleum tolulyticum]SIQ96675.1 hypothetical protein SAMN05421829_108170 [Aromatoleum tolulyticum]